MLLHFLMTNASDIVTCESRSELRYDTLSGESTEHERFLLQGDRSAAAKSGASTAESLIAHFLSITRYWPRKSQWQA